MTKVWSRSLRAAIASCALLLALPAALAVQPDEILPDAALEARARALSAGLRCLVCQNQSIDDSDAPLARDLRLLVRERLEAGDSDAQVTSFIVERYGEFVLLKPTFTPHTLILWLLPPLVLGAAVYAARNAMRKRAAAKGAAASEAPLSSAEKAALDAILKETEPRA